ncbi:hypothetical protein NP493_70g05046 [Ridgeia piscesae]|uniref:Neurobeachin beta-propeller domain-containing protein n=1 Tax=Ridgeia piscesae TaxID=27915 RepID=A0AAD9P9M7_RIDPI|nr:hypothetical protein NP493_70g05046 [Ridgeia piscesae]
MPDTMVAITQEGLLLIHGWLPYDRSISHYFTFERDTNTAISAIRAKRVLAGPFAPGLEVTPSLFAVSHDAKLVFSGGHWDNSVRVYSVNKQKMVAHIVRHTDIVTCLALDNYGQHIITGSRDTTCMIWQVIYQSGMSQGLSKRPTQILYGHTDHVTCVAISEELDMAASGSKDGTVIVHTMRMGTYMRTLRPMCERSLQLSVTQLVLSDVGQICVYCEQHLPSKPTKQKKLDLHLYSVNGKHLASETLLHPLSHMLITDSHLVFGGSQGTLVVKELFGLKTLSTVTLHIPITCMTVTNGNSHILAGLSDGKLIIIGIKKPSEVK